MISENGGKAASHSSAAVYVFREIFALAGKWLKRTSDWVFPTPNCMFPTVFLFFRRCKTVLRQDKFFLPPLPLRSSPQSRLDDMKCGIPFSTKCWGGVMWGREGAALWLAQACCHQRFLAGLPSASAVNSSPLWRRPCSWGLHHPRESSQVRRAVQRLREADAACSVAGASPPPSCSSFPTGLGKETSLWETLKWVRCSLDFKSQLLPVHLADAMSAFEIPAGIYSGAVLFAFSGSGQAASMPVTWCPWMWKIQSQTNRYRAFPIQLPVSPVEGKE